MFLVPNIMLYCKRCSLLCMTDVILSRVSMWFYNLNYVTVQARGLLLHFSGFCWCHCLDWLCNFLVYPSRLEAPHNNCRIAHIWTIRWTSSPCAWSGISKDPAPLAQFPWFSRAGISLNFPTPDGWCPNMTCIFCANLIHNISLITYQMLNGWPIGLKAKTDVL